MGEQQLKIIEDAEETYTTKNKKKWKMVCRGYDPKKEGSQEKTFAFELYDRVETDAKKLKGADRKKKAYQNIMGQRSEKLKYKHFFCECITILVKNFDKNDIRNLW